MSEAPSKYIPAMERGYPDTAASECQRLIDEVAKVGRELSAMTKERDRLRKALKVIANWSGGLGAKWPMEIAAEALEESK